MAAGGTPGETDLPTILRALTIERRPGVFAYVSIDTPPAELVALAVARIEEPEGTTLVLPVEAAAGAGLTPVLEAAWLTLTVHTSLEAVGLTAAVSRALASAGIPCNVIAGTYHDHLLVPATRVAEAQALLTDLSA